MARCAGTKRDGRQCTTIVPPQQDYCYWHDPDRASERSRNASKGGKSTGGREIRDLKKRISEVVEAVLDGSQDRGRAAVAIQGFNSLRGVLELERKVREVDELEARIEQLEQANGSGKEKRWGA
jgi:antitoxin (DNA-binding transcriptional repressor) of toxin-antitoxin stability system